MSAQLQTTSTAVSEQIIGRKKELKIISEVLQNSESSGTSLLIIEGPAGIGKTSIVQNALEKYNRPKCFKLYGKFENHRENMPYLAFRQAFTSWSQQILFLADEDFDALKQTTTSALQTNIAAVTEVFSELEVFFSRKHLEAGYFIAPPTQLMARFYHFLKKFLKSITSLGYQLVIFLDDMQWADKASFNLLEELVMNDQVPGIFFIAASRPAEKTADDHSLGRLTAFIKLKNVFHLSLRPLSKVEVSSMIPVHWNFSHKNLTDFSNYLWLESQGNPFKITEILRIIQREKLVSLKAEDPMFWESLPRLGTAKDSVAFIREQLQNLPFVQLKLIAAASCLSYSFSPELLNKIVGFSEREIITHLNGLVKKDLLIKKKNLFIFTHDTVFSAANSLLSNVEKYDLHRKAGQSLLEIMSNYDNHDFFLAVNHLNKASELAGSGFIYSDEQIILNIHAAKLAIRNTAFEMASNYYAFAEQLLNSEISEVKVKDRILRKVFGTDELGADVLRFLIYHGYAETSFLLQKYKVVLDFISQVLEMKCTRHQRLQATLLKMMSCSALVYQKNELPILLDGIQSLEQILSQYGICIPAEREIIKRECAIDCGVLLKKTAEMDLPANFTKMINPHQEYYDLMNLVTTSMTLMYFIDPYKNLYMVSKTLLLTLREGFAPLSPVLFAASFFTGFFSEENKSLAHLLGRFSLKMIEVEPFKRYSYMVHYIASLNFFPWENHYKVCVKKLEEGILQATESGDGHYVSFCHTIIRLTDTARGKNLVQHSEDCARVEKEHHVFFIRDTDSVISDFLTGKREGFEKGDFQFSEEVLAGAEYNLICRYNMLVVKEKINYFAKCYDAAIAAGEECEKMEYVGEGYLIELEHFFFYSLSLLETAFQKPEQFQDVLKKVEPKLKEFKRLAAFKSGNYLHKVYLLEAEIAKCNANFEHATLLYDLAIREAKIQGFIHHAAIAAERAFEYYRVKNRMRQCRFYLKKSIKYYREWGATAKVEQLKNLNSSLLHEGTSPKTSFLPPANFSAIGEILARTVPGNQIPLQDLGKYLVSLLQKEGNAKKAVILLFQQNDWKVLAVHPDGMGLIGEPLHRLREKLPVNLFNYSIKKGEKMLLQDVVKETFFAADPYLQQERPGNISIFPIKQSGETIGIFYLEDCQVKSETTRNLFLMLIELASTTFANAVYYENNDNLNKELKLQERNRIEAVIESQEKERQRIARELHDSLGQILALSKINISRLETQNLDKENKVLLNQISDLIDESCREVRTISHNLMPPDLDNKSLPEILENLVRKNRQIQGALYEFHSHGVDQTLSVACKFTLYRVLQEILQNIIKHASASKITISLTQGGEFVNLLVEDNGKGFDTSLTTLGLGLKNVHSRIKLLNGYLDIDSSINNGTVFNVSIPLKP